VNKLQRVTFIAKIRLMWIAIKVVIKINNCLIKFDLI